MLYLISLLPYSDETLSFFQRFIHFNSEVVNPTMIDRCIQKSLTFSWIVIKYKGFVPKEKKLRFQNIFILSHCIATRQCAEACK